MDNILKLLKAAIDINIVEAMQHIDANGKGILFIVDSSNKLIGCLSDGDIRRWIIKTGDLNQSIGSIMNVSPKYVENNGRSFALKLLDKYKINAIPVVDKEHKLVDVIFKHEYEGMGKREAGNALSKVPVIIMAGGKGTRLYPYTKILPKPLIPISGIPIVERIMERFIEYGAEHFYMTVNYKKSMIKSYFAETDHHYNISFVDEDVPLGTAGSIRLIEKQFQEPVIITNCDILIQSSYDDIYNYHRKSCNDITVVAALKNIEIPYGILHSKEDGIVISMEEKPNLSYFINTGVYIVNGELLEKIPENTVYHMTDLVNAVMQEGLKVGLYPVSEDSFLDMGEFEEMHRMEEKLQIK